MTSPISEFILSRPALEDCVAGMIVRDTRGCALEQAQRFNFFPASPFPAVGCSFVGDWHQIDQPDQMERPWTGARGPRFGFVGPRLRPSVAWNPGEVYSISIAFYPYALSAMTGST